MLPYLPRQRGDTNLGNFQKPGVWEGRGAGDLSNLNDGIDLPNRNLSVTYNNNPVPDMWSRPLLFEMALYDASHPLHTRISGEWRGLLAMLALKEWRILDIKTMLIDMNTVTTEFKTALNRLKPARSLAGNTTWDQIYIILFKDKPIAFTSPATLICSGADYASAVSGDVSWTNGSFLLDPVPYLNNEEKRGLSNWLNNVINALAGHPNLNVYLFARLSGIIRDFTSALGGNNQPVILSNVPFGMNNGIYEYINRPVQERRKVSFILERRRINNPPAFDKRVAPSRGWIPRSHLCIIPSAGQRPDFDLILIDREISRQWNMREHEHDIRIYNGITLDRIPFSGLNSLKRNKIGEIQMVNAEWRTSDMFFTDYLYIIQQEKAFPGANKRPDGMNIHGSDVLNYGGEAVTPIIPLNKEILNYLSIDDISTRIRFSQSGDNISITLSLPLSGPDGQGMDFNLVKEYKKEKIHPPIRNTPILEIWPNFKVNGINWKAYYTYYSQRGTTGTFSVEPFPEPYVKQIIHNRGTITRTEQFPKAMICYINKADDQNNRLNNVTAGILLITQPDNLPVPVKSFKIGIDFGTTNTSIYGREVPNNPFSINFQPRFLMVTDPGDRRIHLYDDFLPGREEATPFLSLFLDINTDFGNDRKPLLDGHVYFLSNKKFDAKSVISNLKWSEDPQDRIRMRLFLEQICMQTIAEIVCMGGININWTYSFPTAFNLHKIQGLPRLWEQIADSCSNLTGINRGIPDSQTESVASALYFLKALNATTIGGAIFIDIGGSTSDIAVWQGGRLIWQTSICFAGRDIFLENLRVNPDVLNIFQMDNIDDLKDLKDHQFYAQADAFLTQNGKEIFARLPTYFDTEGVKKFIHNLVVGLAGLFYYTGLIIKFLIEKGKYKEEMPGIYIGGNGSQIFRWLSAGGEYHNGTPVNDLFRNILLESSKIDKDFRQCRFFATRDRKAEVAYGLVCDHALIAGDGRVEIEEGVIAGENFIEDGTEKSWAEILTPESFKNISGINDMLAGISHLIDVFNQYARKNKIVSVIDKNIDMRDVRERTNQKIQYLTRTSDPEEMQLESIFILALKSFLEIKRGN